MRSEAVDASDVPAVVAALRAALNGGPAVMLGGGPDAGGAGVPAGTAVVVTTSGSSGHPKSVVLGRAALAASARATAERIGAGIWLLALPAGYIAGVQAIVRSLSAGHEPVALGAPFSPDSFAAAAAHMQHHDAAAYTSLVPAQLATILEDSRATRALAGFSAVLVGGQALEPAVAARAAAAGARIVRTYGSSETAGGCVYDGVPLPGVRVRVVDGEVQLSGPMLADGYLGDRERTDAVFVRDAAARWYRTGDAGSVENGTLRVTGRIDNVIISGGVNVSLDRVERLVRTLPGLSDAVVVPVVDPRWGQGSVIVATSAADLAEVRAAVAAALGAPARPARILLVDRIPQLPSGKPDRTALRAIAEPE